MPFNFFKKDIPKNGNIFNEDKKFLKRQQDIDFLLVLNNIVDSISCGPNTKQKAEKKINKILDEIDE